MGTASNGADRNASSSTSSSSSSTSHSCEDGLRSSYADTELPSDEILQDGWSCLKYIEVDVEGLSDTVIALNDSGSQLFAVNAETVRSLDLPVFGQVKLIIIWCLQMWLRSERG